MQYCHLHTHSSRSFKDGLAPVEELVDKAILLGQPGIALTEHGHMHSAAQLALYTADKPIKPVFGMEIYEAVPSEWVLERDAEILKRPWDSGEQRYHHLTIWVQDEIGWRNLCALHSLSYTPNFKPKNQPLIDRASLEIHQEGLMVGLGCIASKTSWALQRGGVQAAYEQAKWYVEVFGQDRVFMEVMGNLPEQQAMIAGQRKVAEMLGIQVVATNDTHYVEEADGVEHGNHHILVQARKYKKKDTEESGDKSDDGYGAWYGSSEFYLKSVDEMLATPGLKPEEVERALAILDLVSFDFGSLPPPKPPKAPVPEKGEDPIFDDWVAQQGT